MASTFEPFASYRQQFTTGNITTIAAATATAGHILAIRNPSTSVVARVRSIELEFTLTTAFGAAQEVGWDVIIARSFTALHTNQTAIDFTGGTGKLLASYPTSILTGRISNAGALTAGTHTLDTNAIARTSVWAAAIGATFNRYYDYSTNLQGGLYLKQDEGIIARNSILMGATGVGRGTFIVEWDEGILTTV